MCKDEKSYPHAEHHQLKRPCRCGGFRFKEPRMKITNCLPMRCQTPCDCCDCCCYDCGF